MPLFSTREQNLSHGRGEMERFDVIVFNPAQLSDERQTFLQHIKRVRPV